MEKKNGYENINLNDLEDFIYLKEEEVSNNI
jgi:hypothetical protein